MVETWNHPFRGQIGGDKCLDCGEFKQHPYHYERPKGTDNVPILLNVERVNHPAHYGGDNPYEHQKVVRAWNLNYWLGNCTKYICRAGLKPGVDDLEDLQKAKWYLDEEIAHRLRERSGASPERPKSGGVNDNQSDELSPRIGE